MIFNESKWPVETIDGSAPIENIHKEILKRMENFLSTFKKAPWLTKYLNCVRLQIQ